MEVLKLSDFAFTYKDRDKPTLEGVNLSLNSGDFLSIIGPNGAGKSTLVKCILRLHEKSASSGQILVKGRELASYSQKELARIISYVPQAGGWIPPFTVKELLRLSRFPYATTTSGLQTSDYEAIDRALELTSLTAMAERSLKAMSGGERQKAFLAAALAQETEVMILDEPASFLDPHHVAELDSLLDRLNREQGLTMISITHDLNQAVSRPAPVLVLRQGRQVFFGSTDDLVGPVLDEAYRHEFIYMQHPRTGRPVILAE